MNSFFIGWKWSAFMGILNVLGFFGLKMNSVGDYLNTLPTNDIIQYILLFMALYFLARAWFVAHPNNDLLDSELVLRDIASFHKNDEYSRWGFGEHDYCGVIQVNDTWQEWLNQLLKVANRQDLDTHEFGIFCYLYDLGTGNKIKFPQDKSIRESRIGNAVPLGRIFRVMPVCK